MHYHKLLLDELRFVVYEKGDASLTEQLLTKAVTVNEKAPRRILCKRFSTNSRISRYQCA